MFAEEYSTVFAGDERWQSLPAPTGSLYEWDPESTYIKEPPFFQNLAPVPGPLSNITGARVLALLGDSVTTDHISPAGSIAKDSPAAYYLEGNDVKRSDFNSYGSRRGNHEVMIRGTFANIRLRNALVPGSEGNITVYLPTGEQMPIFDAAERYQGKEIPLIVIAGKEYGTGSSRDWAAKGTLLLGVKAVLVESFERIHRSNLVGMGVMPLQFLPGESAASLGLTGTKPSHSRASPSWRRRSESPSPRLAKTERSSPSKPSPASTLRSKSSTTATAASCKPCCAGWHRGRTPTSHHYSVGAGLVPARGYNGRLMS